jgi:formate dehydrogenase subunit gamma
MTQPLEVDAGGKEAGGVADYVYRWSIPMRLFHWTLALAFLGLLGSGLALESADLRGIPFLGSKLVRELHLSLAVLLLIVPAIAASWDSFRAVGDLWHQASHFASNDVRWLIAISRRPVGRAGALPPQGFFNAGQKLNVLVLAVLLGGLAITGAVIAPEAGRPVPQGIRELVYPIHRLLAYATVPILVAHVLLATVWPSTRPALRGMLSGSVRSDWARSHHALWLGDVPPA